MSATPTLTRSAFSFAAAKTIGFALSVFLPLLLVRLLTQTEFGHYKQVFLITNTAVQMLPLSFGLSAFYFFPRFRQQQGEVAFNVLIFNFMAGSLGLTVLLVYPRVLILIFSSSDLTGYAPVIGLVILTWIFASFLEVAATALQDTMRSTMFIVGAQFSKAVFMIGAALWSASLNSLLAATLLQGILQSGILLWYIGTRFPGFWRRWNRAMFKDQIAYMLPLSLAGMVWRFRSDLPSYFVAHRFPAAEYAIFAVGATQLPIIGILQESVGAVMLPRINELHHRGEFRELVQTLAQATRKLSAAYWPCYAFLSVMASEFIVGLYTRRYQASTPIFAVNLLIIPLAMFQLDPVFRAYTELRYYLLCLRLGMFVVQVTGLHFGIKYMGMMGAIGTVVGLAMVEATISIWKILRVLRPEWRDLRAVVDVLKFAGAAALAALPTGAAKYALSSQKPLLALAACAPIFGAFYAAAVWLFGILSPEEKEMVRNRVRMLRHQVARVSN